MLVQMHAERTGRAERRHDIERVVPFVDTLRGCGERSARDVGHALHDGFVAPVVAGMAALNGEPARFTC